MRTNYLGHDRVYVHKRTQNETGWDTAEGVTQTLRRIEAFLADVPLPAHGRIVELGCGAGEQSLHFARKGYRVTSSDSMYRTTSTTPAGR